MISAIEALKRLRELCNDPLFVRTTTFGCVTRTDTWRHAPSRRGFDDT